MLAWWLALLAVLAGVGAVPQSNYNLQNLDVEFEEGEGIPEFGTLDGIVTELGKIYVRLTIIFIVKPPTTTTVSLFMFCVFGTPLF